MPSASCPYCGCISITPLLVDGVPLQCSDCGNSFYPSRAMLPVDDDSQTPSVVVVSHQPATRHQPRLKAGGWFSRAFATTAGILMAICVFVMFSILAAATALAVLMSVGRETQPPAKVSSRR
jgi:hypothetical protein